MIHFRHLRTSCSSPYCAAAGDGQLSLISASPLQHFFCCTINDGVDGRISVSAQHGLMMYADFYSGVTAIDLVTKSPRWVVKIKGVSKLRISQDDEVLIVCRNKPPEVVLISIAEGKVIERVAGVTDCFLESLSGACALLDLKDQFLLKRDGRKSIVHWGQFAVHSGYFAKDQFFASGANATLATYDMLTLEASAIVTNQAFSRCNPIAWSVYDQQLLGVLFEPSGSNCTQLVAFDRNLSIGSVIVSTELVSEAVIFDQTRSIFTSNGKLFDTSSGQLKDELNR